MGYKPWKWFWLHEHLLTNGMNINQAEKIQNFLKQKVQICPLRKKIHFIAGMAVGGRFCSLPSQKQGKEPGGDGRAKKVTMKEIMEPMAKTEEEFLAHWTNQRQKIETLRSTVETLKQE